MARIIKKYMAQVQIDETQKYPTIANPESGIRFGFLTL